MQLVRGFYEAIGNRDLERAMGLMSTDVEIHFPGPAVIPFAGTFRGHAGVEQFFGSLLASSDQVSFDVRDIIADGDRAVALGHEELTAKSTNRSWETDWAMLWQVDGERIARLQEFHETAAIATAFAT